MSLSTVRGSEVAAGRNVEKPPRVHPGLPAHVLGTAAAMQVEGLKVDSRDNSPDTRAVIARSRKASTEHLEIVRDPSITSNKGSAEPELNNVSKHSRSNSKVAVEISLDACPSFAEQIPQGTKPLWLERHHTLKTVHLQAVGGLPSPTGSAPSPESIGQLDIPPEELVAWLPSWDVARSNLWLFVESALLMTQAHAPPLPPTPTDVSATSHQASSQPAHPSPGPAQALLGPTGEFPAQPQALQPAAAVPISRATPFAARPTQLHVVQQEAQAHDLAAAAGAAARQGLPPLRRACNVAVRACPPIPAGLGPLPLALTPALVGLDMRSITAGGGGRQGHRLTPAQRAAVRSASGTVRTGSLVSLASDSVAAAPPAPQPEALAPQAHSVSLSGVSLQQQQQEEGENGATLADSQLQQPTRGQAGDQLDLSSAPALRQEHLAATATVAAAAAATSQLSQDGAAHPQPLQAPNTHPNANANPKASAPKRKDHVAYAAGIAAGTSAAATASQALHAAAGGVAAALDPHGPITSAAVALGTNALHAGATFAMNKMQSIAIAKSTLAAAEAVLGPEASASLRIALRKRLRATVAGASVLWFLFNLNAMSPTLAHLDFDHDFLTSTRVVMNLATNGPALMENCRELLQIGVAVGMGLANRNAAYGLMAHGYLPSGSYATGSGGDGGLGGSGGSGSAGGGVRQQLYAMASAEQRSWRAP